MSITAYVGLPGSGKSYNVVEHVILPALRDNRKILCNVALKMDEIGKEYPQADIEYFDFEKTKTDEFWNDIPGGCVFIIDECWRVWPAGLKANNVPVAQKSFLAEHRHKVGDNGRSLEIVLVTQDLAQIAAFARQLVESTYHHRKLIELGQSNKFSVNIYSGAVTGQAPPESLKIHHGFGTYKPEIFRFYKSHTQSRGGAGDESKTDDRTNFLKSGTFKMMVGGLVSLLIVAGLGLNSALAMFSGEKAPETTQPAPQNPEQTAKPAPKEQKKDSEPAPDVLSQRQYRIVGSLKSEKGSQHYIGAYLGDEFAIVTKKELAAEGIKIEYVSDCLGILTFKSQKQITISCNLPRTPKTDLQRAKMPVL